MQELNTCKKIGYEFYCRELFVVKHKTKYICKSVIYFNLDSLTNKLETHILQNWTRHEQVLQISLQMFDFDFKLLEAPKTLKDFVYQYQQKETGIG